MIIVIIKTKHYRNNSERMGVEISDKIWLRIRDKVINVLKNIFFGVMEGGWVTKVCQPLKSQISIRMSSAQRKPQMPFLIHLPV